MSYQAAFALHLTGVVLFAAVLLLTAAVLPGLPRGRRDAARLWALNAWVATPALVLLWSCGGVMAVQAGWLAMGWLRLKLLVVVALSALHGRQMRTLRRDGARPGHAPLALAAAGLVAIVALAAGKPF